MSDGRSVPRQFLSEFISLYRSHPCLWKVKSKEYSDRAKKEAAHEELRVKLLEIDPEATKEKVLKKINSLRTCFRKEVVKVRRSRETAKTPEEVHKPTLWYFEDLTFLFDQEPPGRCYLSMNSGEEVSNEGDCQNGILSDVDQSETLVSREDSTSSPPCSRKKQRVDDAPNLVANRSGEGQFSMFGKYIAQELEGIPHEMSLYCKRIINEAIFEAQMGTLNRTSHIVTSDIAPQVHDNSQGDEDLAPTWFIKSEPMSTVPEEIVPQVDDGLRDANLASGSFFKNQSNSSLAEVSMEQHLEHFRSDSNAQGISRPSVCKPLRLIGKHFIQRIPPTPSKAHPQRQCAGCAKHKKRKDTVYWCKKCDVGLCLNCFEDYHTKEQY